MVRFLNLAAMAVVMVLFSSASSALAKFDIKTNADYKKLVEAKCKPKSTSFKDDALTACELGTTNKRDEIACKKVVTDAFGALADKCVEQQSSIHTKKKKVPKAKVIPPVRKPKPKPQNPPSAPPPSLQEEVEAEEESWLNKPHPAFWTLGIASSLLLNIIFFLLGWYITKRYSCDENCVCMRRKEPEEASPSEKEAVETAEESEEAGAEPGDSAGQADDSGK